MKLLIILIMSFTYLSDCSNQDEVDIASVVLESRTRGFSDVITVSNDLHIIRQKSSPQSKSNNSFILSEAEWKEMCMIIGKVDLSNMEELQSPTNDRASDRDYITNLTVELANGQSYQSASFDSKHPPQPIEAVVTFLNNLVKE